MTDRNNYCGTICSRLFSARKATMHRKFLRLTDQYSKRPCVIDPTHVSAIIVCAPEQCQLLLLGGNNLLVAESAEEVEKLWLAALEPERSAGSLSNELLSSLNPHWVDAQTRPLKQPMVPWDHPYRQSAEPIFGAPPPSLTPVGPDISTFDPHSPLDVHAQLAGQMIREWDL